MSKLKCRSQLSPSCLSVFEKSTVFVLIRGGVPVFKRDVLNPISRSWGLNPNDDFWSSGPIFVTLSPTNILDSINVPVVIITVLLSITFPDSKITPFISSFTKWMLSTYSSITVIFGSLYIVSFISLGYRTLSLWALRARTAGPLDMFKKRIWIWVLSAFLAISPPSASISLTTIPFAGPPTDGLHGIQAIMSTLPVTRSVLKPNLAVAKQASLPACPPPTTITSYI